MNKNHALIPVYPQEPSEVFHRSRVMLGVEDAIFEFNALQKKANKYNIERIWNRRFHPCSICSNKDEGLIVSVQGQWWNDHQLNHRIHSILGDERDWIEEIREKSRRRARNIALSGKKISSALKARNASRKRDPKYIEAMQARAFIKTGISHKPKNNTKKSLAAIHKFGAIAAFDKPIHLSLYARMGNLPLKAIECITSYASRLLGCKDDEVTIAIAALLSKHDVEQITLRFGSPSVAYKDILYCAAKPWVFHLYREKEKI